LLQCGARTRGAGDDHDFGASTHQLGDLRPSKSNVGGGEAKVEPQILAFIQPSFASSS